MGVGFVQSRVENTVEVHIRNAASAAKFSMGRNQTSRWGIVPKKLTRKQRGEMAEAAFLAVASALGMRVAKPWGESSRYDLIVDKGGKLLRVQVKSAHCAGEYGGYTFHATGNSSRVYKPDEIDVLAAYVVPVGAWYLFPVEEFRKYKSMKLFPASKRRRSKFEKFREAWWTLGVEALS
jgi:hypothetical protein